MQDTEILSQLLNLGEDWHVQSVEIDHPSKRIDIMIAYGPAKKKFLFGRVKVNEASENIILRHLPITGMRTFLHVPAQGTVASNKVWATAGSKLTSEMEAFVDYLLNNTNSNQAVAKISGITAAEVREVSERTGAGTDKLVDAISSITSTPNDAVSSISNYADTKSFELIESGDIPSETNDNWQRIISGEQVLQTNVVGLQMLLQRIRQNIINNPSETTRINAVKLLRQYFIKNQNQHKADLTIIAGKSTQTATDQENVVAIRSGIRKVPADNHTVWQNIINGELQIKTSSVALQMMMERVRQSIERNPSESSRQAGIKILRHFFIKHQKRLSNELQQLGGGNIAVVGNIAATDVSTPAENAICWQALIDGKLKIQTNAVGLQMMMERVRQSVEKNNSDINRMAGIKILRQYFIKHRSYSQNEITQLNGMSNVIPVTSSHQPAIPPENHPNWQRLIDGELIIDTDIVALKMMLQSIRLSVENNPTEASRHAGAKILRQYFIKHQNKHKTELEQLIAV